MDLDDLVLEDPPDRPSSPIQESSDIADYLTSASDEELVARTDAAILQAHQAENFGDPVQSAQRKPRAIRLLTGLAQLTEDRRIERSLLGAEAAITLALLLPEVGRNKEAEKHAIRGTDSLESCFEANNIVQSRESLAHPGLTYLDLAILGYLRAGVGASNRGRVEKAWEHYQKGILVSNRSAEPSHWQAVIQRDIAKALVKRPGRLEEAAKAARSSLDEFEKMRRRDDPIGCYVSLETLARVKVVQWHFKSARRLTIKARTLETEARPGPIHRTLFLRTEARAKHGDGDTDGWLESLSEAISLAERAGLWFELKKIERSLQKLPSEEKLAGMPLLERLNQINQVQ